MTHVDYRNNHHNDDDKTTTMTMTRPVEAAGELEWLPAVAMF